MELFIVILVNQKFTWKSADFEFSPSPSIALKILILSPES
jgi:hypothetical protein